MDKLVKIIREYESDTFNARALGVTRKEAHLIAERLLSKLCEIVEEGGYLRCDGDTLSIMLNNVRGG